MHSLSMRILWNGVMTAFVLAGLGVLLTQFAGLWAASESARPGTENSAALADSLRINVPLMMAFWGFVFVIVSELLSWRLRRKHEAAKLAEPQPDAEKLLNELLTQAESKMALEQQKSEAVPSAQREGFREQRTEKTEVQKV